jgi:hypothetical protein
MVTNTSFAIVVFAPLTIYAREGLEIVEARLGDK